MSTIMDRAGQQCELCNSKEELSEYIVPPKSGDSDDDKIIVCSTCLTGIESDDIRETNHWRCLNESMWSTVPAVQVVAFRQLKKLQAEGWAQDLLGMMYLDESTMDWARDTGNDIVHLDSNGNKLETGDTVTLIQDLNVKGANFTAKRGTAVRRIRLVHDNPEHIEGKVDGQQIVILTKYVKKN